jgi:hypothetical protein
MQQAYYVIGGVSFVLIILRRDMRDCETLTRRLFDDDATAIAH